MGTLPNGSALIPTPWGRTLKDTVLGPVDDGILPTRTQCLEPTTSFKLPNSPTVIVVGRFQKDSAPCVVLVLSCANEAEKTSMVRDMRATQARAENESATRSNHHHHDSHRLNRTASEAITSSKGVTEPANGREGLRAHTRFRPRPTASRHALLVLARPASHTDCLLARYGTEYICTACLWPSPQAPSLEFRTPTNVAPLRNPLWAKQDERRHVGERQQAGSVQYPFIRPTLGTDVGNLPLLAALGLLRVGEITSSSLSESRRIASFLYPGAKWAVGVTKRWSRADDVLSPSICSMIAACAAVGGLITAKDGSQPGNRLGGKTWDVGRNAIQQRRDTGRSRHLDGGKHKHKHGARRNMSLAPSATAVGRERSLSRVWG
ncbi:hypothetical protein CCMA1212_008093 [Trichoderma ghanense]|uniref:Uncharacterized protein n=1 Tax=Trichoderma ghanense TaxID=65468 RepID=A0ABY2GVT3_9HYPO